MDQPIEQYENMDCCRVQWCDLLHGGNVILPEAKITRETLIGLFVGEIYMG